MNTKVFKAYDVRGIYPDDLNEETAYRVGRALVVFLKAKTVVVGRDMRMSGASLFAELTRGITEQGSDVIDIGMLPTPIVSFTVARHKYDAGVMISASHNPAQYNAFKLVKYPAEQLSSETGIDQIRDLCENNQFPAVKKQGKVARKNVLVEYKRHVLRFGPAIKGLKVVADYGNGVGSLSSIPVLDTLDIQVIHMFEEPDGLFPNHPANPHDLENLRPLQERVHKESADLGIFYDGDADRAIMVDENGEIVPADMLLGLLAVDELKRHPNEKVYFDLRFSKAVREHIKEANGIPIMMKVGNPFYKEALLHKGGILAGEFSGHIMFRDNYCIDDGLFAAVKTMDLMCRRKRKLSELILPFKKYYQSEEINMKVTDAKKVLDTLAKKYAHGNLISLDGVLSEFKDWWFSVRMSNTEPLVRLRIEANTRKMLEEKKKELLALIKSL